MTDRSFMAKAFSLAAKAVGGPDPNPPVGAVLVKEGKVIGGGFTQIAGHPHAEIMAIRQAQSLGQDTEDATLYVTLEPCCHYGRTPPCSQAIVEAKIKKVYIATEDFNPQIRGKSIKFLQDRGVEVFLWPKEDFLLEKHLTLLPFFFRLKYHKPVFILKWAQTKDGFLAPGEGKSGPITSNKSHSLLQRLRRLYPILATGANTWALDLPKLSRRYYRNYIFSHEEFRPPSFLTELLLRYERVDELEAYEGFYYRFFLLPKKVPLPLLEIHRKENPEENIFYFAHKDNPISQNPNIIFWDDYDRLWDTINEKALSLGANSLFWETGPTLAQYLLRHPQVQGFYIFCSSKHSQDLGWENPRGFKESQDFALGQKTAFAHLGFFLRASVAYDQEELHYFSKDEFWHAANFY